MCCSRSPRSADEHRLEKHTGRDARRAPAVPRRKRSLRRGAITRGGAAPKRAPVAGRDGGGGGTRDRELLCQSQRLVIIAFFIGVVLLLGADAARGDDDDGREHDGGEEHCRAHELAEGEVKVTSALHRGEVGEHIGRAVAESEEGDAGDGGGELELRGEGLELRHKVVVRRRREQREDDAEPEEEENCAEPAQCTREDAEVQVVVVEEHGAAVAQGAARRYNGALIRHRRRVQRDLARVVPVVRHGARGPVTRYGVAVRRGAARGGGGGTRDGGGGGGDGSDERCKRAQWRERQLRRCSTAAQQR